eukprot:4250029-Prymnesium_polylepis.1
MACVLLVSHPLVRGHVSDFPEGAPSFSRACMFQRMNGSFMIRRCGCAAPLFCSEPHATRAAAHRAARHRATAAPPARAWT